VQFVYKRLGVDLPRVSNQQASSGQRISLSQLRKGDLVAWDNSARNKGADHIAIYLGNGRIAEAPRPGVPLRVRSLGSGEGAWGVRVLGARRG
jgi:cell wall-associated NlpC family hydrolase